jgi:F1F0 ATPase subunit 2
MDASPMTNLHLADFFLLRLCAGFGTGALLGASYFLTLRWNVRTLAFGRAPLLAMGLQLARFALLAVGLVLIARGFGAVPLVAVTAGILVARAAVLRVGLTT